MRDSTHRRPLSEASTADSRRWYMTLVAENLARTRAARLGHDPELAQASARQALEERITVRGVPCPQCKAAGDKWCVSTSQHSLERPHQERLEAANASNGLVTDGAISPTRLGT